MSFREIVKWEQASEDVIAFKKIYADMAGDLVAGLMLSQIVYYHLPAKDGSEDKLSIVREHKRWMAKGYGDWWKEARITFKQARRATKILENAGLIEIKIFKWNGAPTIHICVRRKTFREKWDECLNRGQMEKAQRGDSKCPRGQMEKAQRGDSYTKNTPKNTFKKLNSLSDPIGTDGTNSNGSMKSSGGKKKKSKPSKFDKQAAARLHKAVSKHIKVNCNSNMAAWANDFRLLREVDGVPPDDIKAAIMWYAKNIGGEFIPDAFSAGAFRKKYTDGRIPAAMQRAQNGNGRRNGKANNDNDAVFADAIERARRGEI